MKALDFSKRKDSLGSLKELFFEDMQRGSRMFLRELMNAWMEHERDEFLEEEATEGLVKEKDYRNGYYERTLRSVLGLIERLRVPRVRSGLFYPEILVKGKQICPGMAEGLSRMYLRGISTHKVGEVLEGLLGYRVSSAHVSRVTKSLDRDVALFHKRHLQDDVMILIFDGIYLRSKRVLKSRKTPVLVAYGIHQDGRRELLHFRLAKSESEQAWLSFLEELYRKGLEGQKLHLICTDGCAGLIRALEIVYPYCVHQRCWAHKMRNVAATCKKSQQEACVRDAQQIYCAHSTREAVARFKHFRAMWAQKNHRAVTCIEKDLDALLAFYDFPPVLWKKIRTTNVIERSFGEVRRRTKIMACFPNDASCQRMIYALFAYFNTKWTRKYSYIKVTHTLAA